MDMNVIKRIGKIIQTEATTTSIGDFLLTHVPFENLYLDAGKQSAISEEKLLNEVILSNHDDHKFIMVQGGNGSGKSHLIRWLKEKYVGLVDSEKEAVLLISRAHNTLQDALTQLLEADIFPEEIKENELRAIKNAKSNITGDELKKTINFNFTLEIDADEAKQDAIIDARIRKWLSTYLKDNFIQNQFMLVDNGPIERIRAKIENVNEEVVNVGDDPMFTPEDFAITLSDITHKLKVADGRAADFTIRLAEKFADPRGGAELRKKVADYLNTKVSSVIQRSMKLHTADFKKLFASLRKTLKQQGMNLTLFVEDINSFTGIDEALMEVLLTDHNAEGNQDYCRIISVVGSTNDFYNHKINESIKERIKSNIYIDDSSVIGTPEQLARFAARYINAINTSEDSVNAWIKGGASDDELPVYKCEHKWADIDCHGVTLSIFPFNETALWKLFSGLAPEKKTPRVVLKSIIAHITKLWILSPDNFLSNENNFSNADITMPNWLDENYAKGNNDIDIDSATERGILLRLWGNGTTQSEEGRLGGLTADVFKTFGVYADITGEPKPIEKKQEVAPVVVDTPVVTVTPEQPKASVEKPKKLLDVESDLRNWFNKGDVLSNHTELRDLIYNFIVSGIDWNVEGVPALLLQYINVRGRVHIEGQNVPVGEGFFLPRNEESYYLMIALANWRYMGNSSWDFPDSMDYLITATAWLDKNKSEIVKSMSAPADRQNEWNLPLWNIAALYCVKTLFGGLDITKKNEDIMIDLLSDAPSFVDDATHSQEWKNLQLLVTKNPNYRTKLYSECLAYFSKSVGSATPGETSYKIVDATEIIKCIAKLKELKWDLSGICPKDITEAKTSWNYSASFINSFVSELAQAVDSEKAEANKYLEFFNNIFDKNFEVQNIEESIKVTQDFLKFINEQLNLNYAVEDYASISDSKAASKLSKELESINALIAIQEPSEMLYKLSKNPFNRIIKYFNTFLKLDLLLKDKHAVFSASVDTESKNKIAEHKTNITSKIDNMEKTLVEIGGAVNGNN